MGIFKMNKKELLKKFAKLSTIVSNNCVECKSCISCYDCTDCLECYSCYNCTDCCNCAYCYECTYCYNCAYCIDCHNGSSYVLCINFDEIEDGKYWVLNKKVTKKVFIATLRALDL